MSGEVSGAGLSFSAERVDGETASEKLYGNKQNLQNNRGFLKPVRGDVGRVNERTGRLGSGNWGGRRRG
jgi:hypothetical protein